MKLIKLSLVAALCATVMMAEDAKSDLGVSANVAMTSNYVWRGMTQTKDSPAIQGGFDLDYKGIYAGTWASNFNGTNASSEFDVYAGYAGDISKFSYDVGFIQYIYPNEADELNFAEAYLSLAYDFDFLAISAMYAFGIDTNTVEDEVNNGWEPGNAMEVAVSVPLPMDIAIDATFGNYDDKGTKNATLNNFGNYYSASVSKSFGKFDWNLAYTGMMFEESTNEDQDAIVLTLGTSF